MMTMMWFNLRYLHMLRTGEGQSETDKEYGNIRSEKLWEKYIEGSVEGYEEFAREWRKLCSDSDTASHIFLILLSSFLVQQTKSVLTMPHVGAHDILSQRATIFIIILIPEF